MNFILPRLGRWSSAGGKYFTWMRIYYKWYWTPFCKVGIRYKKE